MRNLKETLGGIRSYLGGFARTDLNYLAKGGFWLSVGHIVGASSSFIIAVLFANLFTKDTYGTYKFVLAIASVLTIATLPGLNTYLAQAVARGFEKTFLSAFAQKIKWGLWGGAAGLLIALYYAINENWTVSTAVAVAALFTPFMDSAGVYNVYLQGKKMFRKAIEYFTINQIIATALLAAALVVTRDLFAVLLVYFASWTGLRLFFFSRTLKRYPPQGGEDAKALSYGKHLSLVGLAATIGSNLDSLLLFHYLGPVEVALYAFALAPIEQIRGWYKNISPLALPKLANRSFKEINTLLLPRMAALSVIGVAIASIYVLAAPFVFAIFFPQYAESVLITQLLAGILALRLPGAFFSTLPQAKMQYMPKSWLYWETVPNVVLIGSYFILIPAFGIYGAIASRYLWIFSGAIIGGIRWRMLSNRHESAV